MCCPELKLISCRPEPQEGLAGQLWDLLPPPALGSEDQERERFEPCAVGLENHSDGLHRGVIANRHTRAWAAQRGWRQKVVWMILRAGDPLAEVHAANAAVGAAAQRVRQAAFALGDSAAKSGPLRQAPGLRRSRNPSSAAPTRISVAGSGTLLLVSMVKRASA